MTTRNVNGVQVPLTAEEEIELASERTASALPDAKAAKIRQLKRETMSRIQLIEPALDSIGMLELMRELFLSIAPAAREPTPTLQSVIDTYQAGRGAIIAIKAMTVADDVLAYDVLNTPAWP